MSDILLQEQNTSDIRYRYQEKVMSERKMMESIGKPQLTQEQLETHLWEAAALLRGSIDSGDYKIYKHGRENFYFVLKSFSNSHPNVQ